MRFVVQIKGNIRNLMRQCGYYFEKEANKELAFARPISAVGSGYPRFHIYIYPVKVPYETVINLHFDQKKPVYQNTPAHAGEYEGEIVEKEAERIKKILSLPR